MYTVEQTIAANLIRVIKLVFSIESEPGLYKTRLTFLVHTLRVKHLQSDSNLNIYFYFFFECCLNNSDILLYIYYYNINIRAYASRTRISIYLSKTRIKKS